IRPPRPCWPAGLRIQRAEPAPPAASSGVAATRLAAAGLDRAVRDAMHEPFDLERGPVHRFRLFRLGERDHRLAFAVHHLSYDGMSSALVFQELRRLYVAERSGGAPPPPPPPPPRAPDPPPPSPPTPPSGVA